MYDVAKEIKSELKKHGYSNRDVSVKTTNDYTIFVVSKKNIDNLEDIVRDVYWREKHYWLCVSVNNNWLPMPPDWEGR